MKMNTLIKSIVADHGGQIFQHELAEILRSLGHKYPAQYIHNYIKSEKTNSERVTLIRFKGHTDTEGPEWLK